MAETRRFAFLLGIKGRKLNPDAAFGAAPFGEELKAPGGSGLAPSWEKAPETTRETSRVQLRRDREDLGFFLEEKSTHAKPRVCFNRDSFCFSKRERAFGRRGWGCKGHLGVGDTQGTPRGHPGDTQGTARFQSSAPRGIGQTKRPQWTGGGLN